jgi:hypothetical protein
MASTQNFLQAASPQAKIFSKYSWPEAKISSKLQVFMASTQDFL